MDDRLPGRLQATFLAAPADPTEGRIAFWGVDDLGEAVARLGIDGAAATTLRTVLPRTPRARSRVEVADVPAAGVPALDAAAALAALPAPADWPSWRRPGDSVLAWSIAAKLALELVAAGRIVPSLVTAGSTGATPPTTDGAAVLARWRAAVAGDPRIEQLARAFPPAAHALVLDDGRGVWAPRDLLVAFLDAVADGCARAGASPAATARAASLTQRWLAALTAPDPQLADPDRIGADLVDRVRSWAASVTDDGDAAVRLCLQLRTPADDEPPDRWTIDYHLQVGAEEQLIVPAADVWDRPSATMQVLGRRIGDPQESLVRGLAEAARLYAPVSRSLTEPRPTGLDIDGAEAAELLTSAQELAVAGLGVLLPSELTATGARRLRARMRIGVPDPGAGLAGVGLDEQAIGAFSWDIALGDDVLTRAEFDAIVALKQPLVRWRGRWVRVDPSEALKLADLADDRGRLDPAQALAAALVGVFDAPDGPVEVVADGALSSLLTTLGERGATREPQLFGIAANLRSYQHRGVAWLQTMADLGLGAVLADDMGLGKTLQTIALLASRAGDRPHLVVCPTSVLGNWERELARFAPEVAVIRHHGSDRPASGEAFAGGAVAITSYGLLRRDADLLTDVDWDVVVLDEAQQVKNPAARAARIVRRLPARQRVALTGTPMENRLSELWAIMDFANPGLLGPFSRFKSEFAVPVERWGDQDAATRLRRIVAPFLLRRTKSDPAVAGDLPRKQELIEGCYLTREQATLYQAAVADVLSRDLGEGIDRRGRILALLTALKQICNHPAQYLGDDRRLRGRSGKLERATELLAEIVAAGDRAIVFTQYRRMGELLSRHLAAALDLPGVPFLHGGVSRAGRDRLVASFQEDDDAPPILLVSLKAGGTGLNLTRATHVLHYDRWWNPAVEDQATDRAYRIGQRSMVTVHKLVTSGTLEERIADVLERKRALAGAVVGAGETWITELSDSDLHALVALSGPETADEVAA